MHETVTVIAKGPSANHAQEFIDAVPETDIAAINDSGHLFQNPIDWLFFTDWFVLQNKLEPFLTRTQTFVFPRGGPSLKDFDVVQ